MMKGLLLLDHSFRDHLLFCSLAHSDDSFSCRLPSARKGDSHRERKSFRFRAVIVKFSQRQFSISFSSLFLVLCIFDGTKTAIGKVAFNISHKCLFNIYRFLCLVCRTSRNDKDERSRTPVQHVPFFRGKVCCVRVSMPVNIGK